MVVSSGIQERRMRVEDAVEVGNHLLIPGRLEILLVLARPAPHPVRNGGREPTVIPVMPAIASDGMMASHDDRLALGPVLEERREPLLLRSTFRLSSLLQPPVCIEKTEPDGIKINDCSSPRIPQRAGGQ